MEPKDGQMIIDVGAGLGHQLVHIAGLSPKTHSIGTERTPHNARAAYDYWHGKDPRIFSHLQTMKLTATSDGRLAWKQTEAADISEMRVQIHRLLDDKILLVEDDVRWPVVVPALLGNDKADAMIHSMPGGSAVRLREWPYFPEGPSSAEALGRTAEITKDTRRAFYHMASSLVRPDGKIIMAERIHVDPSLTAKHLVDDFVRESMGPRYAPYWNFQRFAAENMALPSNVRLAVHVGGEMLSASEVEQSGRASAVLIMEFKRNATPFTESPRTQPF